MKKLTAWLLVMGMLMGSALAAPAELSESLKGTVCWPEGTTETDAAYVYRYEYPQLTAVDEPSGMVNDFYAYLVDDALSFAVPMTAEELSDGGVQAYTNVSSQVTCNNDDYFSVLVTTESFLGASASEVYAGHTFARNGAKAGTVVSLPYWLGILAENESDTWMQERQTKRANELVWGLVWEIIQQQMTDGAVAYDSDLTYEMMTMDFYPEEDFYLDADGNPVFFLQAASIASAAEGVLTFPFAKEELLDEL